jgi:phosphoglucomutase
MALKYKEEGTNLLERLAELREEFGYYLEDLESIRLEGKEGQEVITKTIARLREESPEKIAGRRVKVVKDYKLSTINYLDENQEEEIKLPKSNVLQYLLEGDAKLTIRPSGTEPKLKFYFAVREKDQATAEKVLAGFKENLMSEVEEIMNSF